VKPKRPSKDSIWDLFTEMPSSKSGSSSFWDLFTGPEPPAAPAPEPPPPPPCAVAFDEKQVYWALHNLPATEAPKHFLICGMIGSGKTTAIQLFLQSIAPRFRADRATPEQLILFDAKCDAVPMLVDLGLRLEQENVWLLNPFDERSAVWDLGEAIQDPAMARHLATLLVPEEAQSTAPYFSNAARELVVAVLTALHARCGADWTFRDLLCALSSRDFILAVTAHHPRAAVMAGNILNDQQHGGGSSPPWPPGWANTNRWPRSGTTSRRHAAFPFRGFSPGRASSSWATTRCCARKKFRRPRKSFRCSSRTPNGFKKASSGPTWSWATGC
jgi:hypothetical protein